MPHDQLPCYLDVVVALVSADGRVFWQRVVASVIGYGAGVGSCSKQDFAFRSPMQKFVGPKNFEADSYEFPKPWWWVNGP